MASFEALGEQKGASNAWWGSTKDQTEGSRLLCWPQNTPKFTAISEKFPFTKKFKGILDLFCPTPKPRDWTLWQDRGTPGPRLSRRRERGAAQDSGSGGGSRAAAAPRRRTGHLRCELPGVHGR